MNTAMILSAGRGERLKPLTDTCPKALCLVNDKPLIEHHIINLARAGFEKLIINHAYLGGKIRQYLGNGRRWGIDIAYSPEPPGGLETGGGIFQALPLLGNQPFLTVNADIYTDFDFRQIETEQVDYLHLVLVPKKPELGHPGDFGFLEGLPLNSNKEYTFSGIACYHPQIFAANKPGRYSITPCIKQHIDQKKATASLHQGFWFDIGSMERLEAARKF